MQKNIIKKFKLSDFQLLTTLGVGSFGKVKLARSKLNARYYAIKIMKKYFLIKEKQVDHVINQTHILNSVNHPFIVNMEGLSQDSKYIYIAMQFIAGGQLFSYLRANGRIGHQHAAIYASQIVLVFQYLHQKNIIYRDLKPQNLMIAQDGYLKITDFGFAKIVAGRTFTLCGTPQYLAPEILMNQGHGKPVDWWTLGILIYEMNVGIDPFSDDDPLNIYQNILKSKIKYPKDINKQAKSLIKHLLTQDLSKRFGNLKAGSDDIKNHNYFIDINWENLLNKRQKVYYKPDIRKSGDISNFMPYPDSNSNSISIKPKDDPFLTW